MIDVGTIEQVDPKKLGIHEEHDFTPWLLDNINRIGEVLGIDISVDDKEREVGVGRYRADIEATEVGTNRRIVIENQITPSDHKHMGQIMTYAAGLNSSIVIWVCTEFREEHRQALDWLNSIAEEKVAFLGVEFEFIRIDDSRPAIRFKPVVRPAAWDEAELAGTEQGKRALYYTFFKMLTDELREKHKFTNASKGQYQGWYNYPSGYGDIKYTPGFKGDGTLRVEVRMDSRSKARNKAIFDSLMENQETIEAAYGGKLTWDRKDDYQYSAIYTQIPAVIEAEDKYSEYCNWAVAQLLSLKKAFGPYLSEAVQSAGAVNLTEG